VDTTGLIFVAVLVAWLVYLIPHHLARRNVAAVEEELDPAAPEPTITVHRGRPLPQPPDENDEAERPEWVDLVDLPIATDLTRWALRRDLVRMAARAAQARRRALVALVLLALGAGVVALAGLTAWWTPAAAGVALLAGVVLSRWNVVRVNRRLDRYRHAIDQGSEEATVALVPPRTAAVPRAAAAATVDLGGPAAGSQLSLWEPLPISVATYVSQPSAPRSTRTIDLARPVPAQPVPVVTAEALGEPPADDMARSAAG
jgi:hypothetical protein